MGFIEVVVSGKKYIVADDRRYTKTDEWALLLEGNRVKVGITDYAQKELKDIIGIELPDKGNNIGKGEVLATLESVKATSDVYSPVSGTVVEVNDRLLEEPELLNTDPYGEGWIAIIEASNPGELKELLSPQQYIEELKGRKH